MKFFTFVAMALALVIAVSAEPEVDLPHNDFFMQTRKCIPGQSFIDKCNICSCNAAGTFANCDRMACHKPKKPHIDGFQSSKVLTCPPGKKFFDGCKACTCGESGKTATCTLTADCNVHAGSRRPAEQSAPVARPNLPHIDNFDETKECNPNQSFMHKCNTCHCNLDGKSAACTRMACSPSKIIGIDNFTKGMKCPANQVFYDKCNTCTCGPDGLTAACTSMFCFE